MRHRDLFRKSRNKVFILHRDLFIYLLIDCLFFLHICKATLYRIVGRTQIFSEYLT